MSDFMHRLNDKLIKEKLSSSDARDGILESYVVSNIKILSLGRKDLGFDAHDEEVYSRMLDMMRSLFIERGSNFNKPTASELRSVRHTMDLKLRFEELPYEIRETHDLVCEMLLEKVDSGIADFERETPLANAVSKPAAKEEWEPSVPFSTQAQASTSTEVTESPFLASLQAKMLMDKLSPEDARDGIIESFVVAKTKAYSSGEATDEPKASEGELELLVRGMMRDILAEHNTPFDDPEPEALQNATKQIENRLHFGIMPKSIREEHETRCNSLIHKASILVEGLKGPRPHLKVASFIPITEETKEQISDIIPIVLKDATPEEVVHPVEIKVEDKETSKQSLPTATIEELLASIRPQLEEMIRSEVRATLTVDKDLASALEFPSGIAARTQGRKVFLAWLDSPEQPSYHVYRKEGHGWSRLTATPISRPSFLIEVDSDGEHIFALSAVSPLGVETSLGPQVKVNVDSSKS